MHTIRKVLAAIKKADEMFSLIEPGDRIAVGFSGGKDSMVLLAALERYHHFAKKDFSYVAVYLDLGFPAGRPPYLQSFAAAIGARLVIKDASFVYDALSSHVRKGEGHHLPCSLCSRMKKAAICEAAHELGCNKVAFAHHLDDMVETFFMNAVHAAMLATFAPKMELTRNRITFIRPLVLAREDDIRRAAKEEGFPVPVRVCPSDGFTDREKTKNFLKEIYEKFPQSRENLASSLLDYRRFDLPFLQGSNLPSGLRLEAVSTKERALLLRKMPPKGTETYLVMDKGRVVGQCSLRKIEGHRYALLGFEAGRAARKEIVEHFEQELSRKSSPMVLELLGLSKAEKEALGYHKRPDGHYAKRLS